MHPSLKINKKPQRLLSWAVVILLIIAGLIQYYKSTRSHLENGILVHEAPEVMQVNYVDAWTVNDYTITPLASYSIRARILKAKRYYWDRAADLSPMDIVVGWGQLSDQRVLNHVSISESGRYYTWKPYGVLPVTEGYVNSHTANLHLIPSSPAIKTVIKSLRPNTIIALSGYIVNISSTDGYTWTSNITYNGENNSKIIWVESVSILRQ